MPIPIYSQQIGAPKPPRLRKQVSAAAAKAQAVGQLAGQVQQVGTAFAGRLFDLAAQNELNEALVGARDQWQKFWSDIQKDPEYTSYGDKFKTFYDGLNEDLSAKMRLPKSKLGLRQNLDEFRLKWEDTIERYSDDRAIDQSRAIRRQTINQLIREQDTDGVMRQLQESRANMEFDEQDLATIQEAAIPQIVQDQTMAYARGLGDVGVSWLLSDDASDKFAYQVGDSLYNLDPDTRKSMASALQSELNLRKAQGMAATDERRDKQYREAALAIKDGKLTDFHGLYDKNQFPDLTIPDIRSLENELEYKIREAEDKILDQKADVVSDIKAALDFRDFDYARNLLADEIASGYVDANDEDIKRLQYIIEKAATPVTDAETEKEVNKTRIELMLLGGDPGIEQALVEHAQLYAPQKDTSDFVSHIREQLEQREREARTRAEQEKVLKTTLGAIEHFEEVYYKEDVTEDELKELRTWTRDNFGSTVGPDKKSTWERMLDDKVETLQKPEKERRDTLVKAGEKKIVDWFAASIKDKNIEEANKLRTKRENMLRDYGNRVGEVDDPIVLADFLLNPVAREKVGQVLSRVFGGEPRREETDVEYFGRIGLPEYAEKAESAVSVLEAQRAKGVPPGKPMETGIGARFEVFRKREDGSLDIASNGQELRVYDTSTGQWVPIEYSQYLLFETQRKK